MPQTPDVGAARERLSCQDGSTLQAAKLRDECSSRDVSDAFVFLSRVALLG